MGPLGRCTVHVVLGLVAAGCVPAAAGDPEPGAAHAPSAAGAPGAVGSARQTGEAARAPEPAASGAATAAAPRPATSAAAPGPVRPSVEAYPWLADATLAVPPAVDTVVGRFAAPAGFERVPLEADSFGGWLRGLPLAAPGTPVVSFDGRTLHEASDARIAAVAALDVGKADLQQCADAIMRLWGEWSWARGVRDLRYRLANGQELPYARYQRGERVVSEGRSIRWEARAKATGPDDHRAFRAYLDQVFMFANTGSLAKQARQVGVDALRPGDFVIQPGAPGHAVLVLDLARAADGRRAVLLGQSYMPAQSFQVLRPAPEDAAYRDSAWFAIDADGPGLTTPFWPTFAWSALRRLD